MAIGTPTGAMNGGSSAAPSTGTHGLTINEGDRVDIWINSNSTTSIAHTGSEGTAFTRDVDEVPTSETGRIAHFYKYAGASEPTSYANFTSGNAQWKVLIAVTPSDNGLEEDLAPATHRQGTPGLNLLCGAADARTVADNSIDWIFGGKDNRQVTGTAYTTATQSYTVLTGDDADQSCAVAYRKRTTGETISGNISISNGGVDDSDNCFSIHFSLTEVSGGGGGSITPISEIYYRQLLAGGQ